MHGKQQASNPMLEQIASSLRRAAALDLFDVELRYWMVANAKRRGDSLAELLREADGSIDRLAASLEARAGELADAFHEIDSLREALAVSRRAWPHVAGGRA